VTHWFEQPLLDLAGVDLAGASRIDYLLCQRFRYDYDRPAYDVRQRLVAVPPARHGALHRRVHLVDVSVYGAGDGWRRCRVDRRGNTVVNVRLAMVPVAVEFIVAALVQREGPLVDTLLPGAARRDPAHLRQTALTRADGALGALAVELRASTADDAELAETACGLVGSGLEYGFDATSVHTTAAEAWAIGRGVCQDSAHVLLALCRAAGVSARYVSGHLLDQPGGSHAWVEALVPDGARTRVLALDPSNGCRAGPRHLPVAVGRDYADVAPTSGWYRGDARGRLTCDKHAGITAVGF
jgi:transglutaminase-like putative cysteine protease